MQTEFYEQYKSMIPKVNILFAPHHGRESGKMPTDLLSALNPEIIVIGNAPSEHIHYYDSAKTITQNSAGDIVFEVLDGKVIVYTQKLIGNRPSCLKTETTFVPSRLNYCGTLNL